MQKKQFNDDFYDEFLKENEKILGFVSNDCFSKGVYLYETIKTKEKLAMNEICCNQ